MARRNKVTPAEEFFDMLVALPWWVGPVLAGLVYLFFGFVVPGIVGNPAASTTSPANAMLNPSRQLLHYIDHDCTFRIDSGPTGLECCRTEEIP